MQRENATGPWARTVPGSCSGVEHSGELRVLAAAAGSARLGLRERAKRTAIRRRDRMGSRASPCSTRRSREAFAAAAGDECARDACTRDGAAR